MPEESSIAERRIRCGVLLDGDGGPPRLDVTITIQHGHILAVTDGHAGGVDIDLSEHTVIPGLIDAHAHPCFGAAGSDRWDRVADDASGRFAWGIMAVQAALAAGVTTVIDVGSRDGSALDLSAAISEGHVSGPRLLAAGGALTVTGGHGEEIGTVADTAAELVRAVRRTVRQGAEVIKIMATGGAIDPLTNRRRAQYTTDELRAVVDEANRLNRRVVAHANATEGITRAVEAGVDIIAHCNWLGEQPDSVVIDWNAIDEMVRRGTSIDLNLQGALRDLVGTDGVVSEWPGDDLPRDRWQLLAPLRERAIPIFLTSDGFGPAIASFPASLSSFHESSDVPVEQVVAMASSIPADAHGLNGLGRLTGGSIADLVVLPGDLTKDSTALERPLAVYRAGVEVAREGWIRLASSDNVASESGAQGALLASVLR